MSSNPGSRRHVTRRALPAAADPSAVAGACRAPLPASIAPQIATPVEAVPEGAAWFYELELHGHRLIARIDGGRARLSSAGHWTHRLPTLAAALEALPIGSALLDGAAVVLDARGRTRTEALQEKLDRGDDEGVELFLFDLLYLNGYDLREAGLGDRKRLLRWLVASAPRHSPLHLNDHLCGSGCSFLNEACRAGMQGVICKRADAPYRPGRTHTWLEVKCR